MSKLDEILKAVDEKETSKNHRQTIREFSTSAFKDHIIEVEDERIFYCHRPHSGFYSFRICFLPQGVIYLYGDIGQLALQRGGFGWLASAVNHKRISHYVLEKAKPQITWRDKEFMPGDAAQVLREMHDGIPIMDNGQSCVEKCGEDADDDCWEEKPQPKKAISIAEDWLHHTWDDCGRDGGAWTRAYYENTNDCEGPDCRDYDSTVLWCYHALSWFVRKRTGD